MGGQVRSLVEQTSDTLKETAGGASLAKPGSELFLLISCLTYVSRAADSCGLGGFISPALIPICWVR